MTPLLGGQVDAVLGDGQLLGVGAGFDDNVVSRLRSIDSSLDALAGFDAGASTIS